MFITAEQARKMFGQGLGISVHSFAVLDYDIIISDEGLQFQMTPEESEKYFPSPIAE